jgi:sigma-B regulation protein RsbU (phosphoserine phosphatase)
VPGIEFSIHVEDRDGRHVASAGMTEAGAPIAAAREIRCGPGKASIGRVVGHGSGPLVGAIVASLANAIAALAGTTHEHDPGGVAAHRLEAEMALARRIQRSFVPLIPPDIPGYEVASHYEAAREVGGDFFDVFRVRGRAGKLAIVIADVTGKGVAAAMLMAFARPLIHAAIDHAIIPADALERTNTILVEERRSTLFITAICAIVDLRRGEMKIANGGHEPPLFVPAGDGPVRWLEGSGPLLGAFGRLDLGECGVSLAAGDLVLLYTDGVTDARAANGERFGDDRLLAVVERERRGSARDVVDALAAAIRDFAGVEPAADDVTIVAIRRTERPPARTRRR